jgi:hypothetical protein
MTREGQDLVLHLALGLALGNGAFRQRLSALPGGLLAVGPCRGLWAAAVAGDAAEVMHEAGLLVGVRPGQKAAEAILEDAERQAAGWRKREALERVRLAEGEKAQLHALEGLVADMRARQALSQRKETA